jgi:hypothetical protein
MASLFVHTVAHLLYLRFFINALCDWLAICDLASSLKEQAYHEFTHLQLRQSRVHIENRFNKLCLEAIQEPR